MAEITVSFGILSSFASGYSIGSGIYQINQGDYRSGFIDIGLGFMGVGVLTKAPFAIGNASELLSAHRNSYLSMLDDMAREIDALQKSGKPTKEIAEWAVNKRNQIKEIIRVKMVAEATSTTEKALAIAANKYAEIRNLLTYGNKIGPSTEWFATNTSKGYDQIIAGATRASDDVTRFFASTGWGLLP